MLSAVSVVWASALLATTGRGETYNPWIPAYAGMTEGCGFPTLSVCVAVSEPVAMTRFLCRGFLPVAMTRFLCRGFLMRACRTSIAFASRIGFPRSAQDGVRRGSRFFVTVDLRRRLPPFTVPEYEHVAAAIKESRRKLKFLFLGYVLMPDHWHALVWPAHPLTISRVIQDIKWISARSLNRARRTSGAVWQHQFWDRFVRHAQEFRERLD